ncbi:uncharacterized protein LOC119678194 [Teleopsis dalmanni]|uniref:uncharacterized protein LOC119678194 n=1 Tax=Teleopsis dalmanni TaxID=139649 RepID=UPI0018CFB4C2|nr:uncharacterized protein LOC119678193 isoform X2 [Teleopsis dalmanni]XP_037945821.1 uncharacterized protein LOC119678194 [Teleopsis dalmanni]
MESSTVVDGSSPSSSAVSTQKRGASEQYEDIDELNESSEKTISASAKRFKLLEFHSPANHEPSVKVAAIFKSNKKLNKFAMNVLSPITELTKHLSDANLRTPSSANNMNLIGSFGVTPIDDDSDEENTPPGLKSFNLRLSDEESNF